MTSRPPSPTVRFARALALACVFATTAATAADPAGLWRSLDDRTNRTRALIRIAVEDGKYVGRIEWTDDPEDRTNLCTHCPGDRKNTPIIGLAIIRGIERVDDAWGRGEILDPRNGSTYGCTLRLEDEGRVLVVRGYLGIPLLGGSQRWHRAP